MQGNAGAIGAGHPFYQTKHQVCDCCCVWVVWGKAVCDTNHLVHWKSGAQHPAGGIVSLCGGAIFWSMTASAVVVRMGRALANAPAPAQTIRGYGQHLLSVASDRNANPFAFCRRGLPSSTTCWAQLRCMCFCICVWLCFCIFRCMRMYVCKCI